MLKDKVIEILKQTKNSQFLNEKEQEELLEFLNVNKINEGDAGKLVRLNNSAFSVRKTRFTIPRILKIFIELISDNEKLKEKLDKVKDGLK